MDLVVFKNSVSIHIAQNKLIETVLTELNKIPDVSTTLKLDPELTQYVLAVIRNTLNKQEKNEIDEAELAITILTRLFNLNPLEIETLKKQIVFFKNNKLIHKVSKTTLRMNSVGRWLKRKFID